VEGKPGIHELMTVTAGAGTYKWALYFIDESLIGEGPGVTIFEKSANPGMTVDLENNGVINDNYS